MTAPTPDVASPTPIRVLILEDRPADAELMTFELRRGGFTPMCARVDTERQYAAALGSDVDVILADYTLPQFTAPRALDLLVERGLDIPFIVVTGTVGEEAAVECLKKGAADYLLKDRMARLGSAVAHALAERALRVETRRTDAMLRKSETNLREAQRVAHVGCWEWNAETDTITWSEEYYRIYDLDPGQPPPGYAEHLRLYTPESAARLDAAVTTARQTGRPYELDLEQARSDGARRWVTARGEVTRDGSGRITGLRGTAQDVTERKRTQEALQSLLRDREALLKEVHHRVKNNLQVITSLLRLEARRSGQQVTKTVLLEMQGRIMAMALLHESLYNSGTFADVDLGAYLAHLTTQLFRVLVVEPGAVQLHLDLDSVHAEMDQAMPCGLLLSELVSNSVKHGFPPGRSGEVRVEMHPVDGGSQVRLRVSDTGVGLPDDFEARRTSSLGLQLVFDLARQLGGAMEVGPGSDAVFTVTFPVAEPRPPATSE